LKIRKHIGKRRYYYRDLVNFITYGKQAPKASELIWVNPKDCVHSASFHTPISIRKLTGKVSSTMWDNASYSVIDDLPKFQFCYNHFIEGVEWEETGAYEHLISLIDQKGIADNCKNIDDVKDRYKRVNELYNFVKKEGSFKTKKQLKSDSFREEQGILISINKEGKPYFTGGGNHRFSIAKILDITFPAQIGIVHPEGIKYLSKYRTKR